MKTDRNNDTNNTNNTKHVNDIIDDINNSTNNTKNDKNIINNNDASTTINNTEDIPLPWSSPGRRWPKYC